MLKRKYYSKFRKSDNTAIIRCLEVNTDTRQIVKIITTETSLESPEKTFKNINEITLDFDAVVEVLKMDGYTFIGE